MNFGYNEKACKVTRWGSWAVFATMVIALAVGLGLAVHRDIEITQAVNSLKDRAQVAGTADGMRDMLVRYRSGVMAVADGREYAAVIYQNERASIPATIHNIDRLIGRADALSQVAENSTAYQLGLDDMRRVIADFWNPSFLWVEMWYWVPLLIGLWVAGGVAICVTGFKYRRW